MYSICIVEPLRLEETDGMIWVIYTVETRREIKNIERNGLTKPLVGGLDQREHESVPDPT